MKSNIGKLSIIMPGYNESGNIYNNLLYTCLVLESLFVDFEIIFVNDGSTDKTLEQAQKASQDCPKLKVIHCEQNRGKGNALQMGTSQALGEYIIFLDADLELPPTQIPLFFEILQNQNADVVIGSKMHPDSKINYPLIRKIFSFSYYALISLLFNQKFHDSQTGLKLFKAGIIKPIMEKVTIKKFAFDLEMMVIIAKYGYKIVESPVVMEYSREHRWGRIQILDILQIFLDTIKIFFRYHFSHYYDQPV